MADGEAPKVQITNEDAFVAWLKTQEQRVCCAIACRASLRTLPLAMAELGIRDGEYRGVDLTLASLRANFISGVAGAWPTPQIKNLRGAADSAAVSAARFVAISGTRPGASSANLSAARSADSVADSNTVSAARTAFTTIESSALSVASANEYTARLVIAAAFNDAEVINPGAITSLFATELWQDRSDVRQLIEMWEVFRDQQDPDGIWRFWVEWYDGMLNGRPMDWELQRRVALEIPDEVWDQGAEAVAEAIRAIEKDFEGNSGLDENKLPDRVKELLKNPKMTAEIADGNASLISKAIDEYKTTAPANCLPDGMDRLEFLPRHFQRISLIAQGDAKRTEREQSLEAEIKRLNKTISQLEADLAKARTKGIGAKFRETWVNGMAKTLSDKWFIGGLCVGTAYFFGVDPTEMTFENLRGYIDEIMNAEPDAQSKPTLPNASDA